MKYHTFVELIRPLNGLMAGIGALIGWLIVGGTNMSAPFMAIVAPFFISSGGMVLNDYFDRHIDKNRPLQRKEITEKQLISLTLALYATGLILATIINITAGMVALLAIILLTAYDAFLAKQPLTGNLMVGVNTGLTFVFGAALAGDPFHPAAAVLAVLALFSTLARETYKGIQDMEKDRSTRQTLALTVGKKKASIFALAFNIIAILASPVPFILGIFGQVYLGLILLINLGFIYTSISAFKSEDLYIQSRNMKALQALALITFIIGVILK